MCIFLPLAMCFLAPQPAEAIPEEVRSIRLPEWCLEVTEEEFESIPLGKFTRTSWWWMYVFRYNNKIYSITYYNNPVFTAEVTSGRCYQLVG